MKGLGNKHLEWQIDRLRRKLVEAEKQLSITEKQLDTATRRLDVQSDLLSDAGTILLDIRKASDCLIDNVEETVDKLRERVHWRDGVEYRKLEKEYQELEKENEELKKQLELKENNVTDLELVERSKASTICIYDTILFAIENWSTDGLTAPDVSLCSQSVLFPLVYEQVMKGNEDYYIDKFPSISMEVVRRGRSFVQWLREELPTALNSQEVWDAHAKEVQSWWVNDGLPLLYGARDPNWEVDRAYTFDDMVKWRDLPASRVLEFPLISDGMDLVTKHMDSVRDSVGLKNFNQQQIQTRFTHE